MKKIFLLILLFAFISVASAQSITLNAGMFDAAHYSIGLITGVEYSHPVAKKLDLTVMTGYLHNTDGTGDQKIEYKHIPIYAGMRYYFTKGKISPYFALNLGVSSVSNSFFTDFLIDPNDIYKGTYKVKGSYSGVYFGYSSSLGTMLKFSDSIEFNLEGRMMFVSQDFADFISLTGGLVIRL